MIPLNEVSQVLSDSKASEILLFIDVARNTIDNKPDINDQQARDNTEPPLVVTTHRKAPLFAATFYGCSAGEYSYEWPEQNHSVFTYYLIQGLSGSADKNNNGVTLNELVDYVSDSVKVHAREYPHQIQTPWIEMNGPSGSLLLSHACTYAYKPHSQQGVY